MKTPCKQCVFAQYEQKTQIGCELGLIEKYRAKGLVEECYNGEDEFFVVGQLCMYSRGPEWKASAEGTSLQEAVKEEVRFKADLLIIANGLLDDIKITLDGAEQFTSVMVVNSGGKLATNDIVSLLKGRFKTWYVHSPTVDTPGQEIDVAVKKAKSSYYVVVKAGAEIPVDYCDRVNVAIHEGLLAFIAMKTSWGCGSSANIYNKPIHKLIGGHELGSIEEKVEEICKVSEQPREKYLLEVQV